MTSEVNAENRRDHFDLGDGEIDLKLAPAPWQRGRGQVACTSAFAGSETQFTHANWSW